MFQWLEKRFENLYLPDMEHHRLRMSGVRLLALSGAALLIHSLYSPLYRIPFTGSFRLCRLAPGISALLLLTALLTATLVVFRRERGLWFPALLCWLLPAIALYAPAREYLAVAMDPSFVGRMARRAVTFRYGMAELSAAALTLTLAWAAMFKLRK